MPILPPTSTYSGGASDNNLYLRAGQPLVVPSGSTLISAVNLKAADLSTTGAIFVNGDAAGAYKGAIDIQPGINATSAQAGNGITIRTTAGAAPGSAATTVEIGANAQGPNHLYIAGTNNGGEVGEVYDDVYNQPVSLQPMTMVQTNPNLTPANPEEVLRSGQAGIAAAIAAPGTLFNVFQVPRSGAYMVQTEIAIGNAGPANTVVIPSTVVGGVPIWKSISLGFQVQGTVTPVPYAGFEIIGGDFYGDQAFAASSLITKTFTSLAILQAGVNYAIVLNAEAGWNIGDGGQIKTELVAMC